ncbi:hypothetical protein [Streptomyces cucumeris]|uniref:hypothetical protein n=1 Tax=Streptomyces cucumeris TaxID=2962890 RepID=UPI003D759ECB
MSARPPARLRLRFPGPGAARPRARGAGRAPAVAPGGLLAVVGGTPAHPLGAFAVPWRAPAVITT